MAKPRKPDPIPEVPASDLPDGLGEIPTLDIDAAHAPEPAPSLATAEPEVIEPAHVVAARAEHAAAVVALEALGGPDPRVAIANLASDIAAEFKAHADSTKRHEKAIAEMRSRMKFLQRGASKTLETLRLARVRVEEAAAKLPKGS